MRLETPYTEIQTLVIDDMATQQTTLRGQLAMLGIAHIDAASSAEDALRQIRAKRYQLILCDYNLNAKTDGQQLFEHLREDRLLPLDTLFFMVTAESQYNAVAAASEQVPDAYLLKPITAGDIEDRLKTQLEERQALLPITRALAREDSAGAIAACDAVLARKDRWFMQALQHKAQLQLQLGLVDEAQALYEQALRQRPGLLWAQVGLMRTYKAAGAFEPCRKLAQQVLHSREGERCLAAFDLLAQALEALGEGAAAVAVLQQAAQAVPSARRLRQLAEAAYREGDLAQAQAGFAKALKLSQGSMMGQPQDVLALAQTQLEQGRHQEALDLLADAQKRGGKGQFAESSVLALQAQAWAAQGHTERAAAAAQQALAGAQPAGEFAAFCLARAALATGQTDAARALLKRQLCADHENARVRQMVGRVLTDAGQSDQLEALVAEATQGLKTRLFEAKRLLRAGQLDPALEAIEAELADYPANTTVLIECAQMNCLWLRMNKSVESGRLARVQDYLNRLETLLPGHERVARMRRYLRDTLVALRCDEAGQPLP